MTKPDWQARAVAVGGTPSTVTPVSHYDLVIVGGGIVGLTLACALQQSGLRLALVEAKADAVAIARGQAYAISLLSSQIFQGLGLWHQIQPHVATFRQIRLSDSHYPKAVDFLPQDLGMPALGHVAEHRTLLQVLQDALEHSDDVDWFCPARVTGVTYRLDQAEVTIESETGRQTLQTQLVVAADGARSWLRHQAGINVHGWQYWQSCIVTTVQPEHPQPHIAYERFWPSGPFAILPLPGNRCRIVWTAPHGEAEALCNLSDHAFLAELQRRYGDQMGRLSLVGDRHMFPVQRLHSDRYTGHRLVLIGDAAHCCHPVGGQGLNLGIRDAAALAQVLQAAHQQGEDLGQWSVLKRYERWRRWENWLILGMTDGLNRLFSNHWWPLVLVRRLGLWGLTTIQPLKSLVLGVMTGLMGRVPELAQRP